MYLISDMAAFLRDEEDIKLSEPVTHFPIGEQVICRGLVKKPEFNGLIGTVIDVPNAEGRYKVSFSKTDKLLLLPGNLSIYKPTVAAQNADDLDMLSMFVEDDDYDDAFNLFMIESGQTPSDDSYLNEDDENVQIRDENMFLKAKLADMEAELERKNAEISRLALENVKLRLLNPNANSFKPPQHL